MAEADTTLALDSATSEPLCYHFKWHSDALDNVMLPGEAVMRLTGKVRDVTSGVNTILNLLQHEDLATDGEIQPLMPADMRGNLARLAITSLQMLNDEAESFTDWATKYHLPKRLDN